MALLWVCFINPRLSVCMCVCLLVNISCLERLFVLKTTQRATKVKTIWDFLKPLCCKDPAFPALYGYPSLATFRYVEKCACPFM